MVETGSGPKNIFSQVDQIQIADLHYQDHGYLGLIGIENVVNNILPNPLVESDIQNLYVNPQKVKKNL